MGALSWIIAGVVAWAIGRVLPAGRRGWLLEIVIGVMIAFAAGLTATALDFGGWSELDSRAALFALTCALASLALWRLAGKWRAGL